MATRQISNSNLAATASATTTTTVEEPSQSNTVINGHPENLATATIRLKKRRKKVAWRSDTVDNEGLGKKSSKCCCIYRKPHQFNESSSDSEKEDCDNCRGHVEKKYTDGH